MANNSQDNDLSFLEKKDANALSGKDIFFTVVWKAEYQPWKASPTVALPSR